ncbi:MAG TPA: hypothetical protein VJ925_12760 [Longimicrobiales bacterium]|nr:hypothetical protein [Longimicrobiales bacterium]
MNIIDLMVTIVVVTILVTLVLAVVTYIAYKLRLGREPSSLGEPRDGGRYFVKYEPGDSPSDASATVAEHGTET